MQPTRLPRARAECYSGDAVHAAANRSGILRARPAHNAPLCALCVALAALAGCMDSSISLLPEVGDAARGEGDPRCQSDADCGERSPICNLETQACVDCVSDADCGGNGPQVCLVDRGDCVQCLSDAECSTSEPYCDPDSNYCEECLSDEHCADGETCDPDEERCVER